MFFKQYYQAMQPICVALDILQGEKNAYMGVLLPTIAMCLKRLFFVQGNDSLRLSKPLLDAVTAGVKQRFLAKFEDLDLLLASAFHPQFKLHWIKWLCDIGIVEQIENLQKRIKVKMILLVDSELKRSKSDDSSDGGAESRCSNMESFFEPLCRKSENKRTGYNIVQRFLDENTSSAVTAVAFFSVELKNLFILYNTPIPSSASVERLFSIGKDILKPKQTGLSDEHFEMLAYLKCLQ